MKTLLMTFLALVLIPSAGGGQQDQTADELLRYIRAELPKGWTASYDKDHASLSVSRDEAVSSMSAFPNGPPGEEPEPRKFGFAFYVLPAVSSAEYRRLSAEIAKNQKEAAALYQDLCKRQVTHKFDSFLPRTDSEKAEVVRYEALRDSLRRLPDFYFRDISLQWQFDSPNAPPIDVVDDKIRAECRQVQERVVKLLSKYEAD